MSSPDDYDAVPAETFQEIRSAWDSKQQEILAQEDAEYMAAEGIIPQAPAQTPSRQSPPPTSREMTFEQLAAQYVEQEQAPEVPAAPPPQAQPKESAADLLAQARAEAARRDEQKRYSQYEQEAKRLKEERDMLVARLAKKDPGVLREIGVDPLDFANKAYEEVLGESAPDSFKKKTEQDDVRAEIAALRQELENRDKAQREAQELAQNQAFVQQLDNELIATVQNVPAQYQHMSTVAKNKPQVAYQAMVDAVTAYHKESGGRFPTAQVALQIAEAALGEIRGAFDSPVAQPPAIERQQPEPRQPRLTRSLTDVDTAERTGRKDEIHDPTDFDYWARQGVNAVLRKRAARQR